MTAITQVLTEQATDVGSLSLFRLDPSFGRTLYLADLRVVQLGRKLLQALIWVASGVAKTTANLPKHLTWFLASFLTRLRICQRLQTRCAIAEDTTERPTTPLH